jgi:hypothetical protein
MSAALFKMPDDDGGVEKFVPGSAGEDVVSLISRVVTSLT